MILFVCTGNTCRSPLAELIAREHILRSGTSTEVASAGVGASAGDRATDEACTVALEHGLDLSAHRARRLTAELARSAALVVAMMPEHAAAAAELGAGRIVMIGPIPDPIGRGLDAYRATFALLAERVPRLVSD